MDTPPDFDTGPGLIVRLLKFAKQPCLLVALILTAVVWLIYKLEWPDHPLEFELTSTLFVLAATVCYLTRYVVRKARRWLKKTEATPKD